MSRFSIRKARAKSVLAVGRAECSVTIGGRQSTASKPPSTTSRPSARASRLLRGARNPIVRLGNAQGEAIDSKPRRSASTQPSWQPDSAYEKLRATEPG